MPDGTRRGLGLVAACLAAAALSLLLPWALAFDPWAWLTWGRDVTRLELHTEGGPSWKPLPVVVNAPLALVGGAAPALWLVVARAGGLLAVAGAALLARRLARGRRVDGAGAAVAAAAAMAASSWWLFNTALGNSEGLLAAAVLWAALAHLGGRPRAALALLVAAALLRPEAWPFLGLYALWMWRTGAARAGALALALAPVPLLWFGPDVAGAGGALGASDAARGTASPQSAVYADVPALEVLADFATLVTAPVLLAAVAAVVLGGRTERALAAAALAWVALVAVMTQAGYAGNPRYNVAPAAVACALAGAGVAALAARLVGAGVAALAARRAGAFGRPGAAAAGVLAGRRARTLGRPAAAAAAAVLAAATLAFTAGDLADQVDELGARAERRADLGALVARAGGAGAVRACAPVRTNQPMKAMVAWRLDVTMVRLADPPGGAGTVIAAPEDYDGGRRRPDARGYDRRAASGDWVLATTCP